MSDSDTAAGLGERGGGAVGGGGGGGRGQMKRGRQVSADDAEVQHLADDKTT